MKNIDTIVAEQRQHERQFRTEASLVAFRSKIKEEVKQHGYFSAVNSKHAQEHNDIRIRLHHLPEDFDKHKYLHNHGCFEMLYIYRGCCCNCFPEYEVILEQGDLLLLNPNALHCPYTLSDQDVLFNFMIPIELLEASFTMLFSSSTIVSDFIINYMYQINSMSDHILIRKSNCAILYEILNNIIQEYFNKTASYQTIIQSSMPLVFSYMARIFTQQMDITEFDLTSNTLLTNLLLDIGKNYQTATLESVAERMGYSAKHLSRLIKKTTGKNFRDILLDFKLNYAREYLETTTLPIDCIAKKIGYHNLSHFYRIFKEKYQKSPSEYRHEK